MSFEVRLQLLTYCFEGLLNSSVHVERISKIGLGEKNLFHSFPAFRGLVSQKGLVTIRARRQILNSKPVE